jgi:DNA processing protein
MRQPDFWQALLSLDRSPSKARELLSVLGSSVRTAQDLVNSGFLTPDEEARIRNATHQVPPNVCTVGIDEPLYPTNLKNTTDPPAGLFFKGTLTETDGLAVAIVGTRKASVYGRAVARRFAKELAACGVVIVSGAAHGIDAEAHKGALDVGGRTIAVLGSGLDRPYPASHRGMLEKIAENGAVVSQFSMGSKPDYWRFPLRNYVIAGLARIVIVVEAPSDSGALTTATIATEEGRHVFVTPASIDSLEHRGSFKLINEGATLLYAAEQLFSVLGLKGPMKLKKAPPELNANQRSILKHLSHEPVLVDLLSEKLGLHAGVILAELTALEMMDLVTRSPNGYSKT